jgi:hypothetical protein
MHLSIYLYIYIKTNADVSLVRNFDDTNFDPNTGFVSCGFKGSLASSSTCPLSKTIKYAIEFIDNNVWLVRVCGFEHNFSVLFWHYVL